ncbi:hypothetical protein [Actinomadura vinacea]
MITPQPAIAHLDRLAGASQRLGWPARFCVQTGPRLLVHHPQRDDIHLTITVEPHPLTQDPNLPHYRLSTGPLIPCTNLDATLAAITKTLTESFGQRSEAVNDAPIPNGTTAEEQEKVDELLTALKRQGVQVWHGNATHSWWALVPDAMTHDGTREARLLESPKPRSLIDAIFKARGRHTR